MARFYIFEKTALSKMHFLQFFLYISTFRIDFHRINFDMPIFVSGEILLGQKLRARLVNRFEFVVFFFFQLEIACMWFLFVCIKCVLPRRHTENTWLVYLL